MRTGIYVPSLNTYVCPKCGEPGEKVDDKFYACYNCLEGFFIRNEQPVTDKKSQSQKREYNKPHNCQWCKKSFESNRYDARFCCSDCRVAFHRWSKKTPENVLKDKPLELIQYEIICEISAYSGEYLAKRYRIGLHDGLAAQAAIIAALVNVSPQLAKRFHDLRESFQAASNG